MRERSSIVTFVILALGASSCAHYAEQQRRNREAAEARERKVREAESACYEQESSLVYKEVYAALAADYPIARESERRGYIETGWQHKTVPTEGRHVPVRIRGEAELLGQQCTRVVVKLEVQVQDETGNWSESHPLDGNPKEELLLKIYDRVMQHKPASATARAEEPAAAPRAAPETAAPTEPAAVREPESSASPEAGTEGGPCYGNSTCNEELTCASSLCVRLPGEGE